MLLYEAWQQTLDLAAAEWAVKWPAQGQCWTFADMQRQVDALPPLPQGGIHLVRSGDGQGNLLLQTLRAWRDGAVLCLVEETPPPFPQHVPLPAGIVHLKVTSGSTGKPAVVMFRPEQLLADAENIRVSMSLKREDPNLGVISMAHSYGFSNLVLPLLLHGQPLILAADALPASVVLAAGQSVRVTLPAVPALWRAWHQSGILGSLPIQLAISAGAPLPLELEQRVFNDAGLKLHNFLGSSECGGIAFDASSTPRITAAEAGSVMHHVEASVNGAGCLVVRSSAVADGYWRTASDAASSLESGTFTTTDLARLEDGRIFLQGRATDVINLAGRKLNPSEVEGVLLQHPAVEHCVVFGVPSRDAVRVEDVVAGVRLRNDISDEQIYQWMAARLPSWQTPRKLWRVPTLAPDVRGKISRKCWRDLYLTQC